ncbi:Glycoside hydrolase, family 28 [Dillenia turbinata]|uniref:Glycoside hydrolase, family 28 n=1 Tax=Dillenia turbinata TaxID=194707 RepID=A0AAN8UJH1_9MAGN
MGLMSSTFLRAFIVRLFLTIVSNVNAQTKVFNVMSYGAVADGKTDNTKSFLSAWNDACEWRGEGTVLVPSGTYQLGAINFKGVCNGKMVFNVDGTIKAPPYSPGDDRWIVFNHVNDLIVTGNGVFDGQGATAWPHNSCDQSLNCKPLPPSLYFQNVTNALVKNITSINSKQFHFIINGSTNVSMSSLNIRAPSDSRNTDGIHVGNSNNIHISQSTIGTGDDCISLGPGSKSVVITDVNCGPGHGISVGSLGRYAGEEDVIGIYVKNCNLTGTTNGLRIKTWASPQSLLAYNLTYKNIHMDNVQNPIFIDQKYCPNSLCQSQGSSQVQIELVKFINIMGTSSSLVAVDLKCSKSKPCKGIELNNIHLDYNGEGPSTATCSNVNQISYQNEVVPSCT